MAVWNLMRISFSLSPHIQIHMYIILYFIYIYMKYIYIYHIFILPTLSIWRCLGFLLVPSIDLHIAFRTSQYLNFEKKWADTYCQREKLLEIYSLLCDQERVFKGYEWEIPEGSWGLFLEFDSTEIWGMSAWEPWKLSSGPLLLNKVCRRFHFLCLQDGDVEPWCCWRSPPGI